MGLADDLIDLGGGVGVVDGPGVAEAVAGDFPGVVVVDAAPGERLAAGEIAHAGRVGIGVEVAGHDGGQVGSVARVEVAEGDGLALADSFGVQAPRRGGGDEGHVAFVGQGDRDRQGAPGDVGGAGQAQVENSTTRWGQRVATALPP